MNVTVKNKTPLVVPPAICRRAGLKSGQEIEFKVSGGVITILPKPPATDDEYTPEQRRVIDARLAEGLADIKAGRTFGPFDRAGHARPLHRALAPHASRGPGSNHAVGALQGQKRSL